MKSTICLVLLLATLVAAERHAIIIAPRANWPDYGVQSESCRMYNDLIAGGVKAENIILMSTKKLLDMSSNPYPNKLFTDDDPQGEGKDYAYPCMDHIDYDEKDMTPEVMMAIMLGDVDQLKQLTGKENPRALHSGAEDDVMLYFTSHGGNEVVLVGNGYLTASDLHQTIIEMYNEKLYKNFFFLMEACYSGSMFMKFPKGYNVYAITAADNQHPSYESHCPPNDVIGGKQMNTCLSCLWDNAVEWFIEGGSQHTLDEVFEHSHEKVAEESGQNVSHFGDLDEMGQMKVEQFMGSIPAKRFGLKRFTNDGEKIAKSDVPAHLAFWKAIRAENEKEKKEAFEQYANLKFIQAKQEVELMRLGSLVMGEKVANKAFKSDASEEYSSECIVELEKHLLEDCGHTLPFPESTMKMLRNICLPGLRAPNVDYKNVCM